MKTFFITTPIYYSNDKPHIGSAYTTIAADVIARWQRAKGRKTFFLTGTDEHGAKVAEAAKMAGFKSTQKFCDHQVKFFKRAWQRLNISYDYFVRTTASEHEEFVQHFLTKVKKSGQIYKGKYEGLYCLGCEEFKEPRDLEDGKCPLHNNPPIKIAEENYFFKLSNYQKELIEIIEKDRIKIEPGQRKNEILSFLKKEKLKDISISREKVKWGIELPWDKNQVAYVWVDALLNYLSAGEKYWPADIHLMAKDILKFHAVIWPALLLATGYPLFKKVFAHGFFTLEGKKISKTFGNIVYAEDLLEKYPEDVIRYTLLREIPFGRDSDFKEDSLQLRYNGELANNLGNLLQRTISMIQKYLGGDLRKVESFKKDLKMFNLASNWKKLDEYLEKLQFHLALGLIFHLSDQANQYIEKEKPWNLKDKKQRQTLGNLVEVIREISDMLLPFMPDTAFKIQEQVGGPKIEIKKPLFPKI